MNTKDENKPKGPSSSTSPKRLVLIDDEAGVVLALKLLLQTLGFVVEAFSEPEKALEFIRFNSIIGANPQTPEYTNTIITIDYILCDLRMPKKTGLDVLTETMKLAPHIPFYLMSGHAEDSEQRQAIQLGASGFLAKPFSPGDFLKLINA